MRDGGVEENIFFSLNKRNVSEYSIFFPALLISVFFLFFFANVQKVSKLEVGGQISSGTLQVQDRSSQSSNVPERRSIILLYVVDVVHGQAHPSIKTLLFRFVLYI
jgi:hypothetical protein